MATPEAGTKRVCPESGKKFYDLNKDPIISPYTGESYPLSFFEAEKAEATKASEKDKPAEKDKAESDDDDDDEVVADDAVEIVTLEDADAEVAGDSDIPDLDDDDESEIKLADDDDDTFLVTDDEDDDVSDLIVDADDEDKDV
ncbi:MAG: TIGR02300 family protein [Hyphomicrobiales bacterium]